MTGGTLTCSLRTSTAKNHIGDSGLKRAGRTSSIPVESRHSTIMDNRIYNNERINLNIQGCNGMPISGNMPERQASLSSKMGGLGDR